MVSSEYIEDVRSYENLSKYKIIARKTKEKRGKSVEGSGSHFDGSGEEATKAVDMGDINSDFPENSEGGKMLSDEDFIETDDDDEGTISYIVR